MGRILSIESQKADFGLFGFGRQIEELSKIFGFENSVEEVIRILSYMPRCHQNKTIVDSLKIPDTKSTLFFGAQIYFQALRQRALLVFSCLTPVHQKVLTMVFSVAMIFFLKR
jgi:hypothetical protein